MKLFSTDIPVITLHKYVPLHKDDWFKITTEDGINIDSYTGKEISKHEFERFLERPESAIYHFYNDLQFSSRNNSFEDLDLEYCKDVYNSLLFGAICLYINKNERDTIPSIDSDKQAIEICKSIIHVLIESGFYTSPASVYYHDAYDGGLLKHSLQVAYNILSMYKVSDSFSVVHVQDAVLSALAHDWCKIGRYEKFYKNVKLQDGTWEERVAYKTVNEGMLNLGHGVSSLYMLSKYINLNTQLASAIRWHMGRWNAVESELRELEYCNEHYPLCLMLQFADQLSITKY